MNPTKNLYAKRPNVLFFLIDDMGWRDLGCYGSSFYETPHLDRLAAQGLLFTHAYAACPVCSPTRASILSGKYPARVGVTQYIGGANEGKLKDVPYLHYLPLEEVSVAQALREGGYQTWHVGKWHLGDDPFYPEHHGFEVNLAGCSWGHPHHGYFSPYHIPNLADGPPDEYLTDRLTEETIRLIRNRDRSRPFFLNLWHYAVHTPIQAPVALVEKYRRKAAAMKLDQVPAIIEGEWIPKLYPPGWKPDRIHRRIIQSDPEYAAMMENLDANMGRVLEELDKEGLADDTLVVFTSDNGGLATAEGSPTCNLPLAEGKGWNQEGGTRVCQIVRWPKVIEPGRQTAESVTSTDYYPTFLEAAGLPLRPAQHCDGISLMPLFRGAERLNREAIYWHYPHYSNQGGTPAASVVSGDWKLIEYFEDGKLELFNLAEDLSETRDLAQERPEITRRLHPMLQTWQQEVMAKIPEPNPDYEKRRIVPKIPNNAHI